ncbi:hypothetical protein Taro_038705 [Colocasia esculenta]|uniref:HTH myb-type domain-containing protein n=1 Tax=Colocasia esculenta TaxID=4460 RepID=A0A843WTG3_COLES|nr:hypothetical protein [Colocasia esculenta]
MADTQRRVPSTQARSRLRWTRQLHERFVEAVSALGGTHKATPKSVKKAMGVPGLTLYHLKSHLQKYRLAVKRNPEASCNYREEADCSAQKSRGAYDSMAGEQSQIDGNMLQRNPEVHSKLDEQIEVQRHLQLRIDAQGRYFQTALMRAQEMLAGYGIDSASMGAAASELSEVLSAVDIEHLSCSCSGGNRNQRADCSGDSCLTTWESPEVKTGKPSKHETGLLHQSSSEDADDISSGAGKLAERPAGCDSETENRGGSIFCEGNCDQGGLPGCSSKGHSRQRKRCYRAAEEIDLNREPTLPTCFVLRGAPVLELSHAA